MLKRFLTLQLLFVLMFIATLCLFVPSAQAAINDQIHFQGKVVNSDSTNVTDGNYSFIFTIYDASTAGTTLWTETKTITVTDGIFATDLGSVTDMPASINFNTDSIYLGVEFNGDGEMTPRVRFTAVPYAFNAEKVAGLTVTETTGTLTIPNATIAFSGDNNVTLTSTGATTLTLPTTGTLATLAGAEVFSNKTIASGGLTVASTGWIGIGSGAGKITFTDAGTDTIALENANVGIGTSSATSFVLEVAGNIGPEANNTRTLGTDTKRWSSVHTTQLCLSGDCQTAWPSGSGGSNWRYNLGTLSNVNDTVDLLIGANATASAKFAVLNVNNGTPAASVSSGLSGNSTFITADGTLSTTRRQALIIGNSSSYNTTGEVSINPNGTGNVGIGTTFAGAKLHVAGGNILLDNNSTISGLSPNGTARDLLWISNSTLGQTKLRMYRTANGNGYADWYWDTVNSRYIIADTLGGSVYGGILMSPTVGTTSTVTEASSGTQTKSNTFTLQGQYWNGATTVSRDATIVHNITATTPASQLDFSVAGSTYLSLLDTGNFGVGTTGPGSRLDVAGYIKAPAATFSATYAGGTALKLNAGPSATADIMQWLSSTGTVLGVINSAGNLGIGTSTAANFALEVSGSIGPEANNTRVLGSDTKRWSSVHSTQLCLSGDCKTAWPTGGGSNEWRYNLGTLSSVNDTTDLLIGSNATASAKFAVLNVNNGTPAASISSGLSGTSMFMTANGTVSTTRRMNLTLGNSSGYDTTGDVLINPNGTGNVGVGTTTVDSKFKVVSGNTTRAMQIIGDSVTTGEVIDISADGLTTGFAMNMSSTSNNLTTGGLMDLDWTPTAVSTASGDLFKIRLGAHADTTGNIFALYDNDLSIFLASTTKITSGVPHEFTSSGDVGIAYDIVLNNQTASEIQSLGPLTIRSGESYENLDLTLDPSGTGGVVVADSSDLKLYADQKMIFDVDDGANSYATFDNTNNWIEVFADGSERFRFRASGTNESNGSVTTTLSDVAENYPTMNENLTAGDVVMIASQDSSAPAAAIVDLADSDHRQEVLGVVSSKPGILLGGSSFLSDICEAATASASGKISQRLQLLRTEYKQIKLTDFEAQKNTATDSARLQTTLEAEIAQKLASMSIEELEASIPATIIKTVDDRLNSCEAVKQVPVALAGRVPVKFDPSQGAVKPGDLLSASTSKKGYVSKAKTAGWIIGKALAPSSSNSETVMMFVNITWYGGGDSLASLGQILGTSDVSLSPELSELLSVSSVNDKQFIVSSTNMSVFGTMTAETVAATNKIMTGMLSIGGSNNEITTVNGSSLKLQSGFGAGNIEAFNKKLVFTSEGGVISEDQITAKRFSASEDARGSVYATSNKVRVDKDWKVAPASITLTPEYRADVWVSDITKDGFYINAEPLSANKKIYWWAVW